MACAKGAARKGMGVKMREMVEEERRDSVRKVMVLARAIVVGVHRLGLFGLLAVRLSFASLLHTYSLSLYLSLSLSLSLVLSLSLSFYL